MLYGQSSAEGRTTSGHSEFRDPAQDRAWAQAFLNDFEAADDEDGQRQVLTDYGQELTDPVRQDRLRENLFGRLHRRAEIEEMDPREHMTRLAAVDRARFGTGGAKRSSDGYPFVHEIAPRPGGGLSDNEPHGPGAALAPVLLGIIAATLGRGTVPHGNSAGRMVPGPKPEQLPGFPSEDGIGSEPFSTPMPDRREPPVNPGGSAGAKPVDDDNRTVSPDQSGEWGSPYYQSVHVNTASGRIIDLEIVTTDRAKEQLETFLANIGKTGGLENSLRDFNKIRSAYGLPESAVTQDGQDKRLFTAPDGTKVLWRIYSTKEQGKTVEIHLHFPNYKKGTKVDTKAGDELPKMKIRYGM